MSARPSQRVPEPAFVKKLGAQCGRGHNGHMLARDSPFANPLTYPFRHRLLPLLQTFVTFSTRTLSRLFCLPHLLLRPAPRQVRRVHFPSLLLPASASLSSRSSIVAMDMDGMDMGTSTGSMNAFLHFVPLGDPIWFKEWAPSAPGAVFGACIGLFILAIFERLLSGMKGVMEAWWRRK